MRFGIKEQIIMMEHENERMSYSFEPSDESSGAQGYHQTSYDPNYNQNEHKNPKKKNGVGGRMVALLVAVALVASIGGSVKSNHSISLASPPNTEAISSSVALTVPACVYHLSVFFMIERFVSMSAPWS